MPQGKPRTEQDTLRCPAVIWTSKLNVIQSTDYVFNGQGLRPWEGRIDGRVRHDKTVAPPPPPKTKGNPPSPQKKSVCVGGKKKKKKRGPRVVGELKKKKKHNGKIIGAQYCVWVQSGKKAPLGGILYLFFFFVGKSSSLSESQGCWVNGKNFIKTMHRLEKKTDGER